jgi:hypothetical protein
MFILHKEKILSVLKKPLQYRDYSIKQGRPFEGLELEKLNLLLTDKTAWRNFVLRKKSSILYLSGLHVIKYTVFIFLSTHPT